MLQEQVIPIDFGQGIDTKTDPKLVVPGKLLSLQNGVFTNLKRVSKRNGYAPFATANTAFVIVNGNSQQASGNFVAPQMVHGYGSELLTVDSGLIWSYSQSQNAWVGRGSYVSTDVSRSPIDQAHSNTTLVDCAVLGNYAVYAWSILEGSVTHSQVYGSVYDLSTGNLLVGPVILGGSNTTVFNQLQVKCVTLGNSALAVLYHGPDYKSVKIRTVVFSGSASVNFSNESTIISNASVIDYFDVANTSTGAAFAAQIISTNVTVKTLNTSGAVTATATVVDTAVDQGSPLLVSVNSFDGSIWVYWCETSGSPFASNNIVYVVWTSNLGASSSKFTAVTTASPYQVPSMISISLAADTQTLYFGNLFSDTSNVYLDSTQKVTITSAGVIGSVTDFAYGVNPISKPVSVTFGGITRVYAMFLYRGYMTGITGQGPSLQQPTVFLVDLTNINGISSEPPCVARIASGVATAPSQRATGFALYCSNLVSLTSSKILFSYGVILQTEAFASTFNPSFITEQAVELVGTFAYELDFASTKCNMANNCGNVAIFNGGFPTLYDGNTASEFGFNTFPELLKLEQFVGSGSIANGTYNYIAIYQWVDAQGNLHQSAPSKPMSITTTGANNSVRVYVSATTLSQKLGVSVAIYRTQSNGSVYYLVSSPQELINVESASYHYRTYIDTFVDSAIVANLQAYTYPGNSVLENTVVPPFTLMIPHNNRLWFVNAEIPNEIWYTKSLQNLVGLSPSGFLTDQIDSKYGNITALSEMDEKLVIFKQKGIFVQSGDGASDTGAGSTLSFPQAVPSDVGCTLPKSVVITPEGVMFMSANGIYMISRGLAVAYIGLEVEAYNGDNITAASLIPGKSQIRFLSSTGSTLVYDYIFKQWSTFTNHLGLSATIWNNSQYVYVNTSNVILGEANGTYTDNGTAFNLSLQTSWLALASVQGFQRVKRLILLGDFANGLSANHKIDIQAAYDFSSSFQDLPQYTLGSASASGVLQYRERMAQQKCDTISLLIQEVTTGDSAEYLDLSNISFEAGIKRGVNKTGTTQTVS